MTSMQTRSGTNASDTPVLGVEQLAALGVDELDPSFADGFVLLYEREVPLELRSAIGIDSQAELGALEAILVRVLVLGDAQKPEAVRVQLTSESNLFFHYVHEMTPGNFPAVAESQKLMVNFADYPAVLLRMLNQCIKSPHTHLAVFAMNPTGEAVLDFIQNMEYKFVELLSIKFNASSEEVVRVHVSYRYNVMRARLILSQARIADITNLLKEPNLLFQLQRTPIRVPGVDSPRRSRT